MTLADIFYGLNRERYYFAAYSCCLRLPPAISDQQQSWGYEEGPSKGPGPRSAGGR